MGSESAWQIISEMPVGKVIAWIILIVAIISGICAAAVKLYKLFERYKKLKDTSDKVLELIESHENALLEVREGLKRIDARMAKQDEITMSQISHSIVVAAEKAISEEKITFSQLKSITGLYKEYRDVYHGNGYIKILMERVEELPVLGKPTEIE